MIQLAYSGVPEVAPEIKGGDYQRINAPAEAFGGGIAKGLEQFGAGAEKAGKFFGQVAADDTWNNTQDGITKIMYGDPNQMIAAPDGTMVPDTGFRGLKGRAALDAWPQTQKQVDELIRQGREQLTTPEQQLQFDNISRRYRSYVYSEIGRHADQQANTYYEHVNDASYRQAQHHIALNPDNPVEFAHSASDMINAAVKNAELKGAVKGDPLWLEAVATGKRDALRAQVQSISANDPGRALEILDKNRDIAGAYYGTLQKEFQTRQRSNAQGEQYAIREGINDDIASVLASGQGTNQITPERITAAFGPAGDRLAAEWQNKREDAQQIWQLSHDFSTLSDTEIYDRVDSAQPKPGVPGFTRQQAIMDDLVRRADATYKLRRDDPAKAVDEQPQVRATRANASPTKPDSFLPLAKARMTAQGILGIPEDAQSPITKEEALRLTVPLRSMLPGQERAVVTTLAKGFQAMFGPYAGSAFEYALRAHKIDNATAAAASSVMRRLGLGAIPGPGTTTSADEASEVGAAERMIGAPSDEDVARASEPNFGRAMPHRGPVPEKPLESEPGVSIPRRAIEFLRQHPETQAKFDAEYGVGQAKKILEGYPLR